MAGTYKNLYLKEEDAPKLKFVEGVRKICASRLLAEKINDEFDKVATNKKEKRK